MSDDQGGLDRRQFLKESAAAAAALAGVLRTKPASATSRPPTSSKKVIVIGFDAMDPCLTEQMMDAGDLPNLNRLRQAGGYRRLGTSIPPQTPVAFASFIIGADPGTHGIFDFIHRDPARQYAPMFSAAGTSRGSGYWQVGDHKLQLTFWPFDHTAPRQLLHRQGTPFWDYLDEAGIATHIYEIPSDFPPSPSRFGHHRALAGMGTPDMQGTYGTYQHFAQNGPHRPRNEGGGIRSRLNFTNNTTQASLIGPTNSFLKKPNPATIEFSVHRDVAADAAMIEVQHHRFLLERGQWSTWIPLDFKLRMPNFVPDEHQSGICRFYLQEVAPNFRLYVTPININPSDPALLISEPPEFIEDVARDLGLFYTAGFQEDHKALSNGVFTDEEYIRQTDIVLEERLELLHYALRHYRDGLLFFYFACTDLQPHMFWWDSDERHPVRSPAEARKYHGHVKELYRRMDGIVGDLLIRHGDQATIIVMSDHGMVNFRRQFNLCTWLREKGYIQPSNCKSLLADVDWSRTRAYGLGLNGLYLNLKGRERDGIVDPGAERETLLEELVTRLEAVQDVDGQPVIHKVYRTDQVYNGPATRLAPDLVIGYCRGYRCSWATSLGDMNEEILSDNNSAWSADHCLAAEEVPGILFSNRSISAMAPTLVDLAPTILREFGLSPPSAMVGHDVFNAAATT
ncbi:MAG: alkaline phosphatase family protein [Planctomycetota bacterium]